MTLELNRRDVLKGATIASSVALVDAFGIEPRWLDVKAHVVPVERLPRELDGYTIAQVTDAHLHDLGLVEREIISLIREENVQLLVMTGDIVDSVSQFSTLRELCKGVRGNGAKIAATVGNWEHWGEVPLTSLEELYKDEGARLLVNEATVFDGLQIFGTDDGTAGSIDVERMVTQRESGPSLLLTHSPGVLDTLPNGLARFDLTLSGHTHGGQVRLGPHWIPWVPPGSGRFRAGWYDTKVGRAYVSRGTGTSLLPMRFTCRPEVALFRLKQG